MMASPNGTLHAVFRVLQLALILLLSCLQHTLALSTKPKFLLISFDGFRYDYLSKANTPNFDRVRQEGVWLKNGIKNSYATKTFPNHYTIVTGLFEETHGIVANDFYDPAFREQFTLAKAAVSKWFDAFGAEPIWVTNQVQEEAGKDMFEAGNSTRRTGVVFWAGSEAEVKGVLPFRFLKYNKAFPFEDRVNRIIEWLENTTHPINLALLYISEPDSAGHGAGPDSAEVVEQIEVVDGIVGMLIERLQEANLWGHINIIFTSDHGMAQLSKDRVINLEEYGLQEYDSPDYMFYGGNPVWHVWPNGPEEEAPLLETLKSIEHLMTFRKDEIPADYHYQNNRRIPPILIEAELGWTVGFSDFYGYGTHGYNNSLPEMHPFFIAIGPAFKANLTSEKIIHNVDIFPLMCHLLDLETPPNNGSLEETRFMLKERNEPSRDHKKWQFVVAIIGLLTIVVIATGVTIWSCKRKNKHDNIDESGLPGPLTAGANIRLRGRDGVVSYKTLHEDT